MASIIKLADGTELAVTDGSSLSELYTTFTNSQAAINFFNKLYQTNLQKVTITNSAGETKEYANRVFGALIIQSKPESDNLTARISLQPPQAPSSSNNAIISDLEKEITQLKQELEAAKAEKQLLANKAQGYDIIIGE